MSCRDFPQGYEISMWFCYQHHRAFLFHFRNIHAPTEQVPERTLAPSPQHQLTLGFSYRFLFALEPGLEQIRVCTKPKAVLQYHYSTEHPSVSAVCGFRNWRTAMTAFTAMKQRQFAEMRTVPLEKNDPVYGCFAVTSLFCSNAKVCKKY